MRINVKMGDETKAVELSPRKKDRKRLLSVVGKIQDEGETPELAELMLDTQDEIVVECSNLSQEEFDDLPLEEQNKLVKAVREILFPFTDTVKKN